MNDTNTAGTPGNNDNNGTALQVAVKTVNPKPRKEDILRATACALVQERERQVDAAKLKKASLRAIFEEDVRSRIAAIVSAGAYSVTSCTATPTNLRAQSVVEIEVDFDARKLDSFKALQAFDVPHRLDLDWTIKALKEADRNNGTITVKQMLEDEVIRARLLETSKQLLGLDKKEAR